MLDARSCSRHGSRRFFFTFAVLLVCVLAWAVATPMYGSPDEQVHIVKAFAVVHGDGGKINADGAREFVVPAAYTAEHICYAFLPEQSANCLQLRSAATNHLEKSTADSYPPLFYLLVGWPTLLNSGVLGLYMMRGVAAMWVALLLALALHNMSEVRNRALLLAGAALAMTPALLFFGASVNPSGMSIAAAAAIWTGGFTLLRTDKLLRPSLALAKVGAPLCLFLLLRRDSVLWGGLIGLALLAIAPRHRRRELVHSPVAWMWGLAVGAAALLQLELAGAATASSLAFGKGSLPNARLDPHAYFDQIGGGVLGWLDTLLPRFVLDVFTYGTVLLVGLALLFSPRRIAIAVAGIMALVVSAPLTIGAIRPPYFQGRYMLPFAIGAALVAGLGLAEGATDKRWLRYLPLVIFPLVAVAHIYAFGQSLRRFSAGAHGIWFFSHTPPWQPPVLSAAAVAILYALAIIALHVWMYLLALPGARQPGNLRPRPPDGTCSDVTLVPPLAVKSREHATSEHAPSRNS